MRRNGKCSHGGHVFFVEQMAAMRLRDRVEPEQGHHAGIEGANHLVGDVALVDPELDAPAEFDAGVREQHVVLLGEPVHASSELFLVLDVPLRHGIGDLIEFTIELSPSVDLDISVDV